MNQESQNINLDEGLKTATVVKSDKVNQKVVKNPVTVNTSTPISTIIETQKPFTFLGIKKLSTNISMHSMRQPYYQKKLLSWIRDKAIAQNLQESVNFSGDVVVERMNLYQLLSFCLSQIPQFQSLFSFNFSIKHSDEDTLKNKKNIELNDSHSKLLFRLNTLIIKGLFTINSIEKKIAYVQQLADNANPHELEMLVRYELDILQLFLTPIYNMRAFTTLGSQDDVKASLTNIIGHLLKVTAALRTICRVVLPSYVHTYYLPLIPLMDLKELKRIDDSHLFYYIVQSYYLGNKDYPCPKLTAIQYKQLVSYLDEFRILMDYQYFTATFKWEELVTTCKIGLNVSSISLQDLQGTQTLSNNKFARMLKVLEHVTRITYMGAIPLA